MRKILSLSVLFLLCACGPVNEGTVVSKDFVEAHTETRTHEVYKWDCGFYRDSAMKYQTGCGTGWFEENYEAEIRECRLVVLRAEDNETSWCVSLQQWENLQVGDSYRVNETAYRPGTEA